MTEFRRFTPIAMVILSLIVSGCDEGNPAKPSPVQTKRLAWIGTLTGASLNGDVVIDLTQTGSVIQGEAMSVPTGHLWLVGSASSDSIFLASDPSYPSQPTDFSVRARVLPNGDLSGTMAFTAAGLTADLSCRALPWRGVAEDVTHTVPFDVIAMEYDGSNLWLSTTGNDYIRVDLGGSIVDTIAIYHDPPLAHWTSSELMYDGALLWGIYPITIIGPGGSSDVADLLSFDAGGRAPDSLRVEHRPNGLAHDGVHAWSLREDPATLLELDGGGGVIDSFHLEVPDATQLAFDGVHFWTAGWYMQRLYEVDANGRVVAICDIGGSSSGKLPAGLAVEGSHIWFAAGPSGGTTTLHRLTLR